MGEVAPRVVIGNKLAEAYPRLASTLSNAFDIYVFDIFNFAKSIDDLKGSIPSVVIMFTDMVQALGPMLVELERSGVIVLHVVVFYEIGIVRDSEYDAELGVCGSFSRNSEPSEVCDYIKNLIETCPCAAGENRLISKFKALNVALLQIDKNELDSAIMTMVAEGYTNDEIADKLHYSHATIRNRLSDIMKIVGLTNRTQLAVAWRRHMVDRHVSGSQG